MKLPQWSSTPQYLIQVNSFNSFLSLTIHLLILILFPLFLFISLHNLYQNEKNSHFIRDFIHENSADWQSHLERISDVWWGKNDLGFEFFDFDKIP